MAKVVHARLDDETDGLLRRLRRSTGLGDSELIRRGLRALDTVSAGKGRPSVIGLGAFASGVSDLGSNKRHLDGFGGS
jgi:Ribbon-helix-helix protein, copG family